MSNPTLDAIRSDWRALDLPGFENLSGIQLVSHEEFSAAAEMQVRVIPRGRWVRLVGRFSKRLSDIFYAHQLLRSCGRSDVLIVNGGTRFWVWVGLLNRFAFWRKRTILCWELFVEVSAGLKQKVVATAMKGIALSVLWSGPQVASHAKFLDMPEDRFIFIPYKANHTKGPRYDLPVGNYVFACGNSKRDYQCLTEAVRGTEILVIICATDPKVRENIEDLPNVIKLGATEPDFAKLQASSSFIVIPMTYNGLRGGGETNCCNGMWHEKPVIAADSIMAEDYIIDGKTGYIVPSGDSELLRKRIMTLWNDRELVEKMGKAGHQHVEKNFTHAAFVRRLARAAVILGEEESTE